MRIFKFGGISLKDAHNIVRVGNIIKHNKQEHLVIVVSAMGKTTNELERVHKYFIENNSLKLEALMKVKAYHLDILKQLFKPDHKVYSELNEIFAELESLIQKQPSANIDFEYDKIVSFGEIISSILVYNYLRDIGLDLLWWDMRKILITDKNYKEANILFEVSTKNLTKSLVSKGMHICQGFIGGTKNGESTTLGREGSDYSAAAIAYMLNAKSVTIWKDVPGVLNADPRIMHETIKLDRITYKEAIELAYYGAQIIHPKTIKPLQNKNIPLLVKSFYNPDETGTLINNIEEKLELPPIYIYKYNQVLVSIMPKDFSFIAENNISLIFKHLAKNKIKVNLMQQSAISFSICIDFDERKLNAFLNATKPKFNVLYNTGLTLITIRHYNDYSLKKVIDNNKVIIKELSRNTARFLVR